MEMGQSNLSLASLIGSRICHDLTSPIGAITNGLELLDMANETPGEEVGLIADSVGSAGARIRFFRMAYGRATQQIIAHNEIVNLIFDLYDSNGRYDVQWHVHEDCTRADVQIAFLGIQCCETALPFGGSIEIDRVYGDWHVKGVGPRVVADAELWEDLNRDEQRANVTAAQVQFALLPEVCRDLGRSLYARYDSDAVSVHF
jgi:histidine phosphotransferase ChpT